MQEYFPFVSPHRLAGMPKESPVLLAFSGGVDSSVLLRLLWEDSQKEGYPLILAHVNHGIRGAEALRDRDFCERTAKGYGLEICFADLDIPALAKASGRSLEEEAREARYAFFKQLMKERSVSLLATAHHADDNLETILFRLARGTTSRGLCGILPVRVFEDVGALTRPLLQATRAEILQYAEKNHLEYVTDSTNAQLSCSRNKLRHQVVPVLEELFSKPQHRAAALCEEMRQDEEYWRVHTQRLTARWEEKGCLASMLNGFHPAERSRVLSAYVKQHTGISPEYRHLQGLLSMVEAGHNQAKTSLAGDFTAVIEKGCLRIIPNASMTGEVFSTPLAYGETRLPGSGIAVVIKNLQRDTPVKSSSAVSQIVLDGDFEDLASKGLYWRNRREGDVLVRGGMTRKLRKLYNQKKIPLRLREQMPLLCDEKGILWAPFIGARDGVLESDGGVLISVECSP